ncbi:guanine nucleotide-binding protein G(I)/G(S)/G(O) subunit gamma-10 isoform X1 [Macaca mulatta]
MSSGASASALQRLVEQLKLEAGVERIKQSLTVLELQTEFHHVGQAGLDLLTSGDPPSSSSQSAGITGVSRGAWRERYSYLHFKNDDETKSHITQVSQAAAELQQYCMQNACKDALLVGVPAGSNPFREPRSCALL